MLGREIFVVALCPFFVSQKRAENKREFFSLSSLNSLNSLKLLPYERGGWEGWSKLRARPRAHSPSKLEGVLRSSGGVCFYLWEVDGGQNGDSWVWIFAE